MARNGLWRRKSKWDENLPSVRNYGFDPRRPYQALWAGDHKSARPGGMPPGLALFSAPACRSGRGHSRPLGHQPDLAFGGQAAQHAGQGLAFDLRPDRPLIWPYIEPEASGTITGRPSARRAAGRLRGSRLRQRVRLRRNDICKLRNDCDDGRGQKRARASGRGLEGLSTD